MTDERGKIAILGAGPIGLEAALRASEAEHDCIVQVFDAGRVGENMLRWGDVRMFSPFRMNSSKRGRDVLANSCPAPDEYLTGREHVERYLVPLANYLTRERGVLIPSLNSKEYGYWGIRGVHRLGWPKSAGVGSDERKIAKFLLIQDNPQRARWNADAVIDCSGTFHKPADCDPRESDRYAHSYERGPVELQFVPSLAGKRVAVIGSGYTAATNIVRLSQSEAAPPSEVVWFTRSKCERPLRSIDNDPLPMRADLVKRANEAATSSEIVSWCPGATIHNIWPKASSFGQWNVSFATESSNLKSPQTFDFVACNTGFRPDISIFSELHVHLCYATEGPIKLAAKLLGETGGDCLTQSGSDASLLVNPEPNFFILGAKSYGRNSNFLIRAGIEQVNAVFDELLPETLWPLIGRAG